MYPYEKVIINDYLHVPVGWMYSHHLYRMAKEGFGPIGTYMAPTII
jgi:hypothetical protein